MSLKCCNDEPHLFPYAAKIDDLYNKNILQSALRLEAQNDLRLSVEVMLQTTCKPSFEFQSAKKVLPRPKKIHSKEKADIPVL